MLAYSNMNSSNELTFIKSAGYDEVPSSVLLDTIAKPEIKSLSVDSDSSNCSYR